MTTETLKIRAKNLRKAVEGMLHVPVTHSQALELVAKEENYPNWDAACVSFKASNPPNANPHFAHDVSDVGFRQMLSRSNTLGVLIVVWGVTGQGKTSTARAVVDDLLAHSNADTPTAILHAGQKEFSYLEEAAVRYVTETKSILRSGPLTEQLVVVEDLRDPHTTFEVVAMVLAGAKVIVTLHAKSPIERIRALLDAQGVGTRLLDSLLGNGQVVAITAANKHGTARGEEAPACEAGFRLAMPSEQGLIYTAAKDVPFEPTENR